MGEQEQSIDKLRNESQAVIYKVAEIISGDTFYGGLEDAGEYLAKSPGIGARSETDFPQLANLSEDQQIEIRNEAAKIGIGAKESTGLKEAGLPEGSTVVAEGGLPNKMLAQLKMIAENDRKPGLIIMSASQTRIAGDADKTRIQQIADTFGVDTPDINDKTEFELASISAGLYSGFTSEQQGPMPFVYDLNDGSITTNKSTSGQVVRIGNVDGTPVVVIGVQEYHRDESGKNFYRPSVADLKELAHLVAVDFDPLANEKPVATVTSNLYGPSRRLQNPDTLTYGTKVMEEVVGQEAAPATIQNIVSELDRTREVL